MKRKACVVAVTMIVSGPAGCACTGTANVEASAAATAIDSGWRNGAAARNERWCGRIERALMWAFLLDNDRYGPSAPNQAVTLADPYAAPTRHPSQTRG